MTMTMIIIMMMMTITSLISLSHVQAYLCHMLKIYHHDHHKFIVATSLLSLSLWRNTSLVATEHGWQPPEGAHRPQGTYPIVWRGEIHGHSLIQCYTRMMMRWRGIISYGQRGCLEWDHHN
jgi:hypothetical protein